MMTAGSPGAVATRSKLPFPSVRSPFGTMLPLLLPVPPLAIGRMPAVSFVPMLPKTRSGKIMRRLLKDIAEGRALGDTTTLADPNVVSRLKDMYEDQEA